MSDDGEDTEYANKINRRIMNVQPDDDDDDEIAYFTVRWKTRKLV